MVTHNCNIGTGEAERKRRIAKSLWPVCHTQGTLGRPSYRVMGLPHPQPLKIHQHEFTSLRKLTTTTNRQLLSPVLLQREPRSLHSASLNSTSSFSLATQTKGYENNPLHILVYLRGKSSLAWSSNRQELTD